MPGGTSTGSRPTLRNSWPTFAGTAEQRASPDLDTVLAWQCRLYAGCAVPVSGYIGHFRGDPAIPQLVGNEVGMGPRQRDGLPERVGVWSGQLGAELPILFARVHAGLGRLDPALEPGTRPPTADAVQAVVQQAAAVHGEWIRLHPFANGNGRTARVWANFIALRYGLPAFVTVRPRPDDVSYARAGRDSMGRPPNFTGDHLAVTAVFTPATGVRQGGVAPSRTGTITRGLMGIFLMIPLFWMIILCSTFGRSLPAAN
jgi:Fic/DOC family